MLSETVDLMIRNVPQLQESGKSLARAVHGAVLDGGEGVRDVVDVLHGTWLGHPLHPVLTDIVIGAYTLGSLFDFASLLNPSSTSEAAADSLNSVGNAAVLPTVLAGLADYSTVPRRAAGLGLAHALLNVTAFGLSLASMQARKRHARGPAITLSAASLMILLGSSYLGGHMVFKFKVGTNHADDAGEPTKWTAVLPAEELAEHAPRRVEAAGFPVLLYRRGDRIQAIGAVCAHAGGPLEEGDFYDDCVQCPWHDSVYDLNDGSVVHGPSTYPVPHYDARIRDGQVEVRLAGDEAS
jgi:nitrite reductase/ring-hydroxylating ferredoxin subunit